MVSAESKGRNGRPSPEQPQQLILSPLLLLVPLIPPHGWIGIPIHPIRYPIPCHTREQKKEKKKKKEKQKEEMGTRPNGSGVRAPGRADALAGG